MTTTLSPLCVFARFKENLVYTALGNKDVPKESAELYWDGKIALLNDYKSLEVVGAAGFSMKTKSQDKGLLHELEYFAKGIRNGV